MTDGFVKNAWYPAATASELGRALLGRTYLGEPVVLYRREDGTPVAMEDRCAHRFLPLSKGRLVGDRVQCGYHGLEFDGSGACVHAPGQKSPPDGAGLRTFPLAEKWHLVWIWMGDPALADESLIHDIWRCDHPDWTCIVGAPFHIKGDYRLFTDNLLDPSHVSFVHQSTLGTGDVAEIPQVASQDGTTVAVTRWILDRPAAPIYAKLGGFTGNVDRWQIMTFAPPSMIEADMGSAEVGTGAPEGDRSRGIELRSYNIATPETVTSCHYFWTHVRNFALDDAEMSAQIEAGFIEAFSEDVDIIESVQAGLDRYPDLTPVNLAIDGGPVRARRVIDDLVAAEAA
ncbi:unnamed protein product, partial [Discosporangium mesarthrocarpum]